MSDLRTGAIGAGALPPGQAAHERLRQAAHDFESIFLGQLFREMRASLEQDSEAAPGRNMFVGLFDDAIAGEAAKRSTRGIGEALYRQLAARLDAATMETHGTSDGTSTR